MGLASNKDFYTSQAKLRLLFLCSCSFEKNKSKYFVWKMPVVMLKTYSISWIFDDWQTLLDIMMITTIKSYFWKTFPLPPGKVYGCCFLKTCPTRLHGIISKEPPHCQTRKESSKNQLHAPVFLLWKFFQSQTWVYFRHNNFFINECENNESNTCRSKHIRFSKFALT